MRRILAVTRRELGETRNVWPAAAVASFLAFLSPFLPGFRRELASDVRTAIALFLAGSFFVGLAVVLGVSVVGRDLKDRRMGFYFSKPLSAFAIWGGKFLGATLLAFGSAFLVLLPTALVEFPGSLRIEKPMPLVLAAGAALAFASFHVVHGVSIAVRSRSPLLLVDLALAGGVGLTTATVAETLVREHAIGALRRGWCVFALTSSAAFMVASFASVARGRTDIRAAHRALSTALWSILLPATALFALYGNWVLAVTPNDLRQVDEVLPAPSGSWVALAGPAHGRGDYRSSFLLDVADGRFRKLGEPQILDSIVFSRDGRLAAWLERDSDARSFDLHAARLDGGSPTAFRTKLSFESRWTRFTLSPNGDRIAVVERHQASSSLLSVYDLGSGRLLGSGSITEPRCFFFVAPDRVRVYSFDVLAPGITKGPLEISELDLTAKKIDKTGKIESLADHFILRAEPLGRRLLVQEFAGGGIREIRLHDARTGDRLSVLSSGDATWTRRAAFLSDGRIAVAEAGAEQAGVRIFSAEGGEQRNVPLARGVSTALGGEFAGGRVIIAVRPSRNVSPPDSMIFLVDTTTGEPRQVATGLSPASTAWMFATDPSLTPSPGSDAARLFVGRGFSLVLLDPLTGERRSVVPPEKRH